MVYPRYVVEDDPLIHPKEGGSKWERFFFGLAIGLAVAAAMVFLWSVFLL